MSLFTVIFIFQFLVLPVNLLRGPCVVLIIVAVVSSSSFNHEDPQDLEIGEVGHLK